MCNSSMAGDDGRGHRLCTTIAIILALCSLAPSLTCFSLQRLGENVEKEKEVSEATVMEVRKGRIFFNGKELDSQSGSASATESDGSLHADFDYSDGTGNWEETSQLEDATANKAAWRRLNPSLHCGQNKMKFKAMGPGAAYLKLQMGNAHPLPLIQVPEPCGYSMKQNAVGLVLVVRYSGCNVIQENGNYVLPMSWLETPVKFTCPILSPASTTPMPVQQPWKLPLPDGLRSLNRHKRGTTQSLHMSVSDPHHPSFPDWYYHYLYNLTNMAAPVRTTTATTTAKPVRTTTATTTAEPVRTTTATTTAEPVTTTTATTTAEPVTTTTATTTAEPVTTTAEPATTTAETTTTTKPDTTTTKPIPTRRPTYPYYPWFLYYPYYLYYYPYYPYYYPNYALPNAYGKPKNPNTMLATMLTTLPPATTTAKPDETTTTATTCDKTTTAKPDDTTTTTKQTTKPSNKNHFYPYDQSPFSPYLVFHKAGKFPADQKYMPQAGNKHGLQARAHQPPHPGFDHWQPLSRFPHATGQDWRTVDWKNLQPKQV